MPEEEEAERYSSWVWDWFGSLNHTKSRSLFEEIYSFIRGLLLVSVEMIITTRLCFFLQLIPLLIIFFFTPGICFSFPLFLVIYLFECPEFKYKSRMYRFDYRLELVWFVFCVPFYFSVLQFLSSSACFKSSLCYGLCCTDYWSLQLDNIYACEIWIESI